MYYLTSFDDENIMQLLSYSKNYICKFMQANIINYFKSKFVVLNLESVERKLKNYKNLNISRTKSGFSMK